MVDVVQLNHGVFIVFLESAAMPHQRKVHLMQNFCLSLKEIFALSEPSVGAAL